MEIKPTYVTFEQAKWLKEKGFKYYCQTSYWNNKLTYHTPGYPLENGETSQENYYDFPRYYAPEQWQVVEWLRVKKGIWVHVYYLTDRKCWGWDCYKYLEDGLLNDPAFSFNMNLQSPQEAYSSAFDFLLNYYANLMQADSVNKAIN
jgi:hypothetical protein